MADLVALLAVSPAPETALLCHLVSASLVIGAKNRLTAVSVAPLAVLPTVSVTPLTAPPSLSAILFGWNGFYERFLLWIAL